MTGKTHSAGFAALLGVNKSTICRAIQAGRLQVDEHGLLDVADSLERWAATRSGLRPDVAARIAAERAAKASAAVPPESAARAAAGPVGDRAMPMPGPAAENAPAAPAAGHGGSFVGRQHYTAVRLDAANRLSLLEIELRTHQRYPLESIRREAHALGSTLRAGLERLIDQTAPLLAMTSDRAQRAAILDPELRALRRLLRKSMPRALRSLRRAADGAR